MHRRVDAFLMRYLLRPIVHVRHPSTCPAVFRSSSAKRGSGTGSPSTIVRQRAGPASRLAGYPPRLQLPRELEQGLGPPAPEQPVPRGEELVFALPNAPKVLGSQLWLRQREPVGDRQDVKPGVHLPQHAPHARHLARALALPVSDGKHAFPRWQFDGDAEDGMVPGLSRVLRSFSLESPWMQAEFMLSPEDRLGDRRPLDALKAGEVEVVARAVSAYGEHVAR